MGGEVPDLPGHLKLETCGEAETAPLSQWDISCIRDWDSGIPGMLVLKTESKR